MNILKVQYIPQQVELNDEYLNPIRAKPTKWPNTLTLKELKASRAPDDPAKTCRIVTFKVRILSFNLSVSKEFSELSTLSTFHIKQCFRWRVLLLKIPVINLLTSGCFGTKIGPMNWCFAEIANLQSQISYIIISDMKFLLKILGHIEFNVLIFTRNPRFCNKNVPILFRDIDFNKI